MFATTTTKSKQFLAIQFWRNSRASEWVERSRMLDDIDDARKDNI